MRPQTITLIEHQAISLPAAQLSAAEAHTIWQQYSNQIDLEPPSLKTDQQWRLTALGWVGHIPLSSRVQLALLPKTPLQNLFTMVGVAYHLPQSWGDGVTQTQSLAQFWDGLAHAFATRVLDRCRKGLHHSYLAQTARVPALRGRLQFTKMKAGDVALPCRFEQFSADILHNQLILAGLKKVARSGLLGAETAQLIHKARRLLDPLVSDQKLSAIDCDNVIYDRLTEDYRPIHALCRFILDQTTPSHESGDQTMLPFLFKMSSVFERFVANWLSDHMPDDFTVAIQPSKRVGDGVRVTPDIVIKEQQSGQTVAVLDTKYKTPTQPSNDDIYQIEFYANTFGAQDAILIYPQGLGQPLQVVIRGVRLGALAFDIGGDLEPAGQRFLADLLRVTGRRPSTP